eukprot:CAMPEP_0184698704 /NCGR_PEP_ID=MMETSP0313-20130426/5218_1 /TAXON_ID=2792 /ORGANISM="Porphyridium aerugineum, Strain SAG 1380-2" /LENGTH=399 /DNA_ID=CAMNT_0027157675 /DNA_START=918 /DNA_END=2118 /DNA_ORIENTATION=-
MSLQTLVPQRHETNAANNNASPTPRSQSSTISSRSSSLSSMNWSKKFKGTKKWWGVSTSTTSIPSASTYNTHGEHGASHRGREQEEKNDRFEPISVPSSIHSSSVKLTTKVMKGLQMPSANPVSAVPGAPMPTHPQRSNNQRKSPMHAVGVHAHLSHSNTYPGSSDKHQKQPVKTSYPQHQRPHPSPRQSDPTIEYREALMKRVMGGNDSSSEDFLGSSSSKTTLGSGVDAYVIQVEPATSCDIISQTDKYVRLESGSESETALCEFCRRRQNLEVPASPEQGEHPTEKRIWIPTRSFDGNCGFDTIACALTKILQDAKPGTATATYSSDHVRGTLYHEVKANKTYYLDMAKHNVAFGVVLKETGGIDAFLKDVLIPGLDGHWLGQKWGFMELYGWHVG